MKYIDVVECKVTELGEEVEAKVKNISITVGNDFFNLPLQARQEFYDEAFDGQLSGKSPCLKMEVKVDDLDEELRERVLLSSVGALIREIKDAPAATEVKLGTPEGLKDAKLDLFFVKDLINFTNTLGFRYFNTILTTEDDGIVESVI